MYRDSLEYAQDRFSNVLESCTVLTPAEVMEVLRIGKNSVYTLLNSGKLRGFRIGMNTPPPDGHLNRPSQTP